jgi:hypothetical protein
MMYLVKLMDNFTFFTFLYKLWYEIIIYET